jgi:hypothetical protein
MEVVTILAMGFVCMACFLMGAKVGQTVSKGEKVELPSPMKAVQEHRERKEAQMEQSRLETIMRNIESYDGTPYGQKEVPGR